MLPGCCKNGIVISKIPVMQAGLKEVGNDSNLLIVFYVQIMPD
ncbi:hypothetical protein N5V60_19655, partial [Escherichia coli]|nr:hypothetical protein [Escherichia coli]